MPNWLINLILSLIVKFGLPAVIAWVKEHFPWFPIGDVGSILCDYSNEVKVHKHEAKKRVKARLSELSGARNKI